MRDKLYSLQGATLVTPTRILPKTALTVSGGVIELDRPSSHCAVQLPDHLVFPGLINAHDHLNGTWWPRVGPGRPYANVYQWLADLDASPVRYDRQQNSVEDVYELGMYRNLISGVTTVADHFWRFDSCDFYTRHPIHILYEYGRTWTPQGRTAWGADIPFEYDLAVRTGQPYIIHLAEGVDGPTANEMDVLVEASSLGRNTLIVHGISLRPDDVRAMARVGASVCWCPASNLFLYGQTANVRTLMKAGVNIALGTDSSLTGSLNLLDEMRFARCAFRDQTGEDPSPQWLVERVTTCAAYALLLDERRGRLETGYEADLLVLPETHADPYTALIEADIGDIALLICAGIPVYGDTTYEFLFEQSGSTYTHVTVTGKKKLISGHVNELLNRLSHQVGRKVEFPFLPLSGPTIKNRANDS